LAYLNFAECKRHSGILFDVLEKGLQQRMTAGMAPLKLLDIRNCSISTEHANDLQKLVQDFDWDENEEGSIYFDDNEQYLYYDPGEDVYFGLGPGLLDWDSDGSDDHTDRWDDLYGQVG